MIILHEGALGKAEKRICRQPPARIPPRTHCTHA